MELASEKGACTWLMTLLVDEFGFALHKSAFHDALASRYGWKPNRTSQYCACSSVFSVEHALSCPKGSSPTICHNEIRDLTASLLTEVCHEVSIEPDLQIITGSRNLPEGLNQHTGWSQTGCHHKWVLGGRAGMRDPSVT